MKDYYFFWKCGNLSQWGNSDIDIGGVKFITAEQAMMYCKAILFGDVDTSRQIQQERVPYRQKQLGRAVKNFDQVVWDDWKIDIVYVISYLKFTQNEALRDFLIAIPLSRDLVEASPYDRVWGIGLNATDSRSLDSRMWLGENLLGEILTVVRNQIINDTKSILVMERVMTLIKNSSN